LGDFGGKRKRGGSGQERKKPGIDQGGTTKGKKGKKIPKTREAKRTRPKRKEGPRSQILKKRCREGVKGESKTKKGRGENHSGGPV